MTSAPHLDDRAAVLDGPEPFAYVRITPDPTDPEQIDIAAGSHSMNAARVAYALRSAADRFDARALADGIEPIPYRNATQPAADDADLVPYRGEHGYPEGEQPAAAEDRGPLARLADDLDEHIRQNSERHPDDPARAAYRSGLRAAATIARYLAAAEQAAPIEEPQPPTPAVGDRYVKRAAPDAGRVITVNNVWTADDGHTGVAYEWDDPRASYAGSACPLDVFHRTYEPAEQAQR